jgi:hypothetical protein
MDRSPSGMTDKTLGQLYTLVGGSFVVNNKYVYDVSHSTYPHISTT